MFQTLFTQPLYNGFIYLIGVIPGGDVGFAIIALTCIVRFIFYPIFASQIRTTMVMQSIQGELEEIKQRYKTDQLEQSKHMLELYKKYKVNPFSLILSLLIQIPIFIALYFAFFHTKLPTIDPTLLYPFVPMPDIVNILFLGFLDLGLSNNLIIVVVATALQFLVIYLTLARTKKHTPKNLPEEKLLALKMQQNIMLYVMPGLIAVITYTTPAAVGLYFAASSLISLGQEWLIRRQLDAEAAKKASK